MGGTSGGTLRLPIATNKSAAVATAVRQILQAVTFSSSGDVGTAVQYSEWLNTVTVSEFTRVLDKAAVRIRCPLPLALCFSLLSTHCHCIMVSTSTLPDEIALNTRRRSSTSHRRGHLTIALEPDSRTRAGTSRLPPNSTKD